MLFVENRT